MDRFRIKSIENLVLNYDLKSYQKRLAIFTLIKKIKIIINGAYKRKNYLIINEYEKKLNYWEKLIIQLN